MDSEKRIFWEKVLYFIWQNSTDNQHKICYNIKKEMVNMRENYLKSLHMIKILDIKTEEEYKKLLKNYLLLSTVSLKYISQTDDFNKIIVQAKEVE